MCYGIWWWFMMVSNPIIGLMMVVDLMFWNKWWNIGFWWFMIDRLYKLDGFTLWWIEKSRFLLGIYDRTKAMAFSSQSATLLTKWLTITASSKDPDFSGWVKTGTYRYHIWSNNHPLGNYFFLVPRIPGFWPITTFWDELKHLENTKHLSDVPPCW